MGGRSRRGKEWTKVPGCKREPSGVLRGNTFTDMEQKGCAQQKHLQGVVEYVM